MEKHPNLHCTHQSTGNQPIKHIATTQDRQRQVGHGGPGWGWTAKSGLNRWVGGQEGSPSARFRYIALTFVTHPTIANCLNDATQGVEVSTLIRMYSPTVTLAPQPGRCRLPERQVEAAAASILTLPEKGAPRVCRILTRIFEWRLPGNLVIPYATIYPHSAPHFCPTPHTAGVKCSPYGTSGIVVIHGESAILYF